MPRHLLATLVALGLVACGPQPGSAFDAGPDSPADAGSSDAGPVDAGPATDAGPPDAGPPDAGLVGQETAEPLLARLFALPAVRNDADPPAPCCALVPAA